MSAMIVLRRGQQAMFSKPFWKQVMVSQQLWQKKKKVTVKRRDKKLRMKNIGGMFDDTQVMQEAQR